MGGWLFDHVGPKVPFYYVGVLDIVLAVICAVLSCCGVIRNDIKERKLEAQAVEEKRKRIEQELRTKRKSPVNATTYTINE